MKKYNIRLSPEDTNWFVWAAIPGTNGLITARRINMVDKIAIWNKMAAIAREFKLPQMYPNDVWVHDKNYIQGAWSGQSFVWILRTCGSHIWRYPQHGSRMHESAEDLTRQVLRTFGDPEIYLFFCDGYDIEMIAADDFFEKCRVDKLRRDLGHNTGVRILEATKGGL